MNQIKILHNSEQGAWNKFQPYTDLANKEGTNMKSTITLDIPRLGGIQEFKIFDSKCLGRKDKYVCSTWNGDGLDNNGDWDIFRIYDSMNYVAVKA